MTRNTRLLIGVVVIAAAAAAYWMLLLSPKRQEAATLTTKVSVAQAQLAQSRATLADYEQAKTAYQANYSTYVGLGKAVPADDDTRSLLVQLDASAKRSGVDFSNLDVQQSATTSATTNVATAPGAVSAGGFSAMPFTFAFGGTFSTLSDFLARLGRFVTLRGDKVEVNGRLVRIDSIQLQPGGKGWPTLQAQIGAVTFMVPDAAAQAPAATAAPGTTAATGTTTTTTAPSTSADTAGTTATDASDLR